MKKYNHILSLLSVAALTLVLSVPAYAEENSTDEVPAASDESSAETFTSGDYEYTLNKDDTAMLSRYLGSDTEIVIPDTIDGYDVTVLGGGIFANKDDITAITLPETLKELKDSCFYGCTSLETFIVPDGNVDFQIKDDVLFSADGQYLYCYPQAKTGSSYAIPEGVTEIWSSAFANTSLTDISFPDGLLYIDDWTFSYTQLSELTLPDSVKEIGGYAFSYCTRLTEVDFPADLEIIDAAAFSCDSNLTKITLPDGLQTIQMAAFAGTGMKEVTIPASVTYIGFCAFGYEEDMQTAVKDFVVYGETGSQAQTYCTDSDEENDYENHFTFCSILSSDDDSSESDSPVQIEAKEEANTLQSAVKWILMGVGIVVLVVGGLVLILGGRKKQDSAGADMTKRSKKAEKLKSEEQKSEEPEDEA